MFELLFTGFLLLCGLFIGGAVEKRHYASLKERERLLLALPTINTEAYDLNRGIADAKLVTGNVVVAMDYFKWVAGMLRNLVGGRVAAYESLVDRARREATLRMREEASGYDVIINTRIETSSIGGGMSQKGTIPSIEAYAYGTAIKFSGPSIGPA